MRRWVLLSCTIAAAGAAREGLAQPCCTGATTISPARLAPSEDVLVGLFVRASARTGQFARNGEYVGGGNESLWAIQEDLFIGARLVSTLQAGVTLALLQTYKQHGDRSDFGGGLGDLGLSMRYDVLEVGEHDLLPGIAVATGLSLPTGRTLESSTGVFGADATSSGFTQGALALSVADVLFGRLYVDAGATYTHWFPRTVEGVSAERGGELTFTAGASWVVARDLTVGGVASFEAQGVSSSDGRESPGTNRHVTTLGLVASLRLDDFRVHAGIFDVLPIDKLARNETALLGAQVALIWAPR